MTFRPKRIAPPRIIADAASALYGQIDLMKDEEQRARYINAITKAFNQLMDGVRFEKHDDGTYAFPSRTRNGKNHHVNGTCDCEASEGGNVCWARAARRLIEMIAEVERSCLMTPPDAPPQCGRCGAAMFEQGGRHICPSCQHSRQAPTPPPRPRTAISAAQAQREIDELYG